MKKNDNLSKLPPIQKFINGVGKEIEEYFGSGQGCIIGLGDDGFLYGLGFYQWLRKKNKKINFTSMDDEGKGLEEEKIKGRKILIIDNDIVTGRAYKKAMDVLREKKEILKIKDIKFAVLSDRIGLADFSVESYSALIPWSLEEIDALDFKIIKILAENGRESFAQIARKVNLSIPATKNRIEQLIKKGILKIKGGLNIEKFCTASAQIFLDVDPKKINELINTIKKSPLIFSLMEITGKYNLVISICCPRFSDIEDFLNKEIRSLPYVKNFEVVVGKIPIIPETFFPS